MIIDHFNRFCIVTSSKCGTHTLEAAVKSTGFADRLLPRHSARVPLTIPVRILMVRDPYDRFSSMWFHQLYMDADYNVKERDQGFEAWTAKFFDDLDSGKENVWLNNLSKQSEIAQATHFFKTQDIWYLFEWLRAEFEVSTPTGNRHVYRNKTRNKRQAPYDELSESTKARLEAWCAPDALLLRRAVIPVGTEPI